MTSGFHSANSFNWLIRQNLQRLSEWGEFYFSKVNIEPPEFPDWGWIEPLGQGLFWVIIVSLCLWLGWLLYEAIARYLNQHLASLPQPNAIQAAQLEIHSPQTWWRMANAAAQAGQYETACRALYMAALQVLHDTQRLPHDLSRTDGEYLQDIRSLHQPRPYQLLIRTHERLEFGASSATPETYQRCRRAYQEIDQS